MNFWHITNSYFSYFMLSEMLQLKIWAPDGNGRPYAILNIISTQYVVSVLSLNK